MVAALIVAAAVIIVIVMMNRRRTPESSAPAGPVAAPEPSADGPPPMTGLEAALQQVTDREGRPIREAIDAEAGHVDELRVPDDTGPLLRRALDHVARPGDDETQADPDVADDDAD